MECQRTRSLGVFIARSRLASALGSLQYFYANPWSTAKVSGDDMAHRWGAGCTIKRLHQSQQDHWCGLVGVLQQRGGDPSISGGRFARSGLDLTTLVSSLPALIRMGV